MPNNKDRREVAARLRAFDESEWSSYWQEFDAIMTACMCNFGQDYQEMELKDRLADLIEPEPEITCNVEQIPYMPGCYEGYWCSVCHCIEFASDDPNYCPNCGARVVE